jgi:hypothetical protein
MTTTIDTMDALSAKVQHITAALTALGLQTWIEQSRAGTHPKYFSIHGVSQSYYIHARGAKGDVTLRVSDHDNPQGMGSTACATVGDIEAEVDATIAKFLADAKKLKRYSARAHKAALIADWQSEADEALSSVDVVWQVRCAIESRYDDDETDSAILDSITDEAITGVAEVLDAECDATTPTYAQIFGAYQHIRYMQMNEHLDRDRAWSGNDRAAEALGQLDWAKKYYDRRFPHFFEWGNSESAGYEWANTLLNEIIDVTDAPKVQR